jgi:hypothetical protein
MTRALLRHAVPCLAHWESTPDPSQAHAPNKACACTPDEIVGWIVPDDYHLRRRLRRPHTQFQRKRPGVDPTLLGRLPRHRRAPQKISRSPLLPFSDRVRRRSTSPVMPLFGPAPRTGPAMKISASPWMPISIGPSQRPVSAPRTKPNRATSNGSSVSVAASAVRAPSSAHASAADTPRPLSKYIARQSTVP